MKKLEDFITAKIKYPNTEEIAEILSCFEIQTFQKGDYFKAPFTRSKELGFLMEGSLRLVIFKEDGNEMTGRIIQENSLVADVFSTRTGKKTPIGIQCVSDVTITVAPLPKIYSLLDTNLALNITMREHITERAMELGKDYLLFISANAEERYQLILENNPSLLQKFPLHFIASLIGVTPTQLSRIRNKKTD